MSYQVLARKYRPQFFRDVVGQEHVTRTLLNALEQGRIAHGYIFSGHRGIGKTTIARILAMALNCRRAQGSPERPTAEPCGSCDACTEIRSGSAVDVIEIDAATNRGIDEIRELREAARYRPARDRYKIYILDEAHQITDAAFNALLKTLEEPPEHVVFMMATTQPEDIPQTIRSRSQHYAFHAVRFDDILGQLRGIAAAEQLDADDGALALLAEAGDGSMRDALSIMDQAIASAPAGPDGRPRLDGAQIRELMGTVPNAVFERLLELVSENNTAAVMTEVNALLNAGNAPSPLARQMVRYLRNTLMARLGGETSELLQISADERARAVRSAMLFSEEDLTRFLQIMLRSFDEMNYRQEPRFHLELALLKLVHAQRLIPLEQLMTQLPGGGGARGSAQPGRATPPAPRGAADGNAGRPPAPDGAPGRASNPSLQPSGGSAGPAAGGPAASGSAASSGSAGFSPFEADTRRKSAPAMSRASGISGVMGISEPTGASGMPRVSGKSRGPGESGSEAMHAPVLPVATVALEEAPGPSAGALREDGSGDDGSGAAAAEAAGSHVGAAEAGAAEAGAAEAGAAEAGAAEAGATEPGSSRPQAASLHAEPPDPPIRGHVSEQQERVAADLEEELASDDQPEPPQEGECTSLADRLREAVTLALHERGHETASALLGGARWTIAGETLSVEVAVRRTMLSLTMNPEAERIARTALQQAGSSLKLSVVPGDGSASAIPAAAPAARGSVQAEALENPLVKKAQELFRAEVRSVLDLRGRG